jgi:hypothetical protein
MHCSLFKFTYVLNSGRVETVGSSGFCSPYKIFCFVQCALLLLIALLLLMFVGMFTFLETKLFFSMMFYGTC